MRPLLLLFALLWAPLAFAQGPAGDPRDNLEATGTPTDRYLDASELRAVLHAANDAFYGCYRTHVRGTKEAGEVAVRFQVERSGAVSEAAAELSGGAPASLGPCLEAVVRGLEFDEHDGDPVLASYPLVYQVDRQGARVLPYPVVFTKPRAVRLPLLTLPMDVSAGELRMLERILVDDAPPPAQGEEGTAPAPAEPE